MFRPPSADREAAERPSAAWPFWVGLAGIAIALVPSLDRAFADWREDQRLRTTVLDFFTAVSAGQKETAIGFMTDEYRSAVESGWNPAFDQHWQPTEHVVYQILSMQRDAAEADVRIAIVKGTFSLKPTVHLRRLPEGGWRIASIDGVAVDPRWIRWKAEDEEDAETNLADELARKLNAAESHPEPRTK